MLVQLKGPPAPASDSCSTGACASVETTAAVPFDGDAAKEKSRLERDLTRLTGKAIHDFDMIADGDRILVAMSGGKDSYVMMRMLSLLRDRAPVNFTLVGVNVDQGYRGYRADIVEDWLKANGYESHVEPTDIDEAVKGIVEEDGTACSLCARLRRGVLYRLADELKCNKIALGHHLDDVLETVLLNLFFAGELKTMPLKLVSDDGKHTVIRPLGYAREDDIRLYAKLYGFPIIGCMCKHCGDVELQRQKMKALLKDLERQHPGLKNTMLKALKTVKPSHLLDLGLQMKTGQGAAAK
ncbi:MAG TPA: tRNA 2-thiocytidine(32) synthetase TtcA, partial [bacterium]|nr:tRNA 2-thiocytidine(32) synthetase TtcA [bacterium]